MVEDEGKIRRKIKMEDLSRAVERKRTRYRKVISNLTTDEAGNNLQGKVKDLVQSLGSSEEVMVRKVIQLKQLKDKKYISYIIKSTYACTPVPTRVLKHS